MNASLLSQHHKSDKTLKFTPIKKLSPNLKETFYKNNGSKQKTQQKSSLPIISRNPLKQSRHSKHSSSHKQQISQLYKEQLLHRDKEKNPLKYKIIGEFIGMDDDRVYELKKDEIFHIQRQYLREKGRQNFQQGRKLGNRSASTKSPNFNSYIHKIFGSEEISKFNRRSNKSLNHRVLTSPQRKLRQHQEILGKKLFNKVEKYLVEQKNKPNFFKRVKTISAIDSAFIDHIKLKIKRAETQLS